MAKTRHMQARMNQRAIDQQLVDMVSVFGSTQERGDVEKQILNRKGVDKVIQRLDRLRGSLIKVRDKGGLVVVTTHDGVEITAYRLDSFSRQAVS